MKVTKKYCGWCDKTLSIDSFNKQSKTKDGRQHYCRQCQRAHKMQYRYGITLAEAHKLLSQQDGLCPICHDPLKDKFVIDHCHASSVVRGILCNACNVMLGQARDDVMILQRGIEYLNKRSKR